MATLDTILETLENFDNIEQSFVLNSHKFIRRKKSDQITAIKLEGYTDGYPVGAWVTFHVDIEPDETMSPEEIVARVDNRDDPDYDYATDPEYHDLEEEPA